MPGSVLSVNAARPAPLRVGSRMVSTAFLKAPVRGPVAVGADGLEGDEQGDRVNHGGRSQAVYAYASEDTAWWADVLGRPLGPAAFAENLTLAGVDVSGARIGERWRIGTAELQVTAPRVPCAKLGARHGDPGLVRRFARSGRPGAYLAVPVPGSLRAGDAVERVHRPAHDVTVALVLHVMLHAPERIGELEPARGDMLSKLRAWVHHRAAGAREG